MAQGGPFTSAAGDFTVPVGVCSSGQNENGTAYWVGIQGPTALIQTGFNVVCKNGQPTYQALHSTPQSLFLPLTETVLPGDQIDEAVSCSGSTCSEDLDDVTQNWTSDASYQVIAGYSGNFAAVVGESNNGGATSSATVVTGATVDGAPIGQSDAEADQETLSNYDGAYGLDPTPLNSTGEDFDLFWDGAGGQVVGNGGMCATVAGGSTADRTPVELETCDGSPAQQWTAGSGGTVTALGMCLGVVGGATANGSPVDIYDCNGSTGQEWTASNGELINENSGTCLDDTNWDTTPGTQLQIWTCNPGQANQIWTPPAT